MLHDTGFVVWHNVPKLRDIVICNPQWLADAMAGVVTFICQDAVAANRGMTNWGRMRSVLKLKYSPPPPPLIPQLFNTPFSFPGAEVHNTIISLLEYFEIIYKVRMGLAPPVGSEMSEEQMFFVPSLLAPYANETTHPSMVYWNQIDPKYDFYSI